MLETSQFSLRLAAVRRQIALVCAESGRRPEDITLVAVSKTFSFAVVADAYQCGQLHFGENYMQDCLPKIEQAAVLNLPLKWHFIGHLQRNKARYFDARFFMLHSLDSLELARQLGRQALVGGYRQSVLVQVNVSHDKAKYGVKPSLLLAFMDRLRYVDGLSVEGLMTIPAITGDDVETRSCYRRLAGLFAEVRNAYYPDDPGFRHLSMGMSGDFMTAIAEGATIIRIGTLLFGER
ncbi:MAG TPA: YggS family pyridoxal phosphate-dependent enzyme [Proteobacteria bacterium]|nr:YggS family pyridoxal phosphate-dependent enzyme [Pseudomonadota bacterium]